MKNVKNFNEFINEELNVSTYDNAGQILKNRRHYKRGDDLIKYGSEIFNKKLKDINKNILTIDGEDISCEEFNIIKISSMINIFINYNEYKIKINLNEVGDHSYESHVDLDPSNGIVSRDRKTAKKLLSITKEYLKLTDDLIYELAPNMYEYVIDFVENATINDFYN